MIYVTLGTMFLDFERLVHAVDRIAEATGEEVVVQLGLSKMRPQHCTAFDFRPHDEVLELQRSARVIVGHAGIGTALDALAVKRPFIIVPRLRRYNEHMNDHQVEIAEAVQRRGWGRMVTDMAELDEACANPPQPPTVYRPNKAPLLAAVRAMVDRVAERKGP